IPTVKSLYMYEETPEKQDDPLVVYATSAGYKWFFSYPEEKVETVNHLTIPKDRPVVFKLQSMDMMTSFWIPQLGGQKYAMTGMTMDWTLTASEEGTFRGRNSNFNGEGFARQTFDVNSVSQSEFKDWVKDAQSQKELDQDTFDKTKEIKEDVLDKPNKPARKPQITNANYERHGMKAMILGNNEPYNSEFKDEESHNMDEMEKISEGAKDEQASESEKKDHEHGGGH